ncbi:archaeal proteasome endopeptidase complex subunit alpha [Haloarchaeobius sp. HME9146]|uniref:archaeal proteasome endopeptidase complex subunit alpha n=1 Tax=Haloarchaeobius sp. HME9146 TaxID=2978732 RepID=UPI0021C056AB|nr:archaeal proteasome endopeptidase complex subunit alpha [Haloarchaeobius sp. HME9146]MCT9095570.1 archaeal proteasome endopeptidase complex subunit alpha [Haloarchaeobius sp. HME9146]
MQGQSQQQAYDRGITIFSPDGRLYQVEYAREAVKRGSASVGVRTPDGVVLAAERRSRSPLMERDSVEKLHKVDDHIGLASAGHVADARQLIDVARREAQVNQLRYNESIGVETLTKAVTDHIQQYTQTGGARPFGVALLVGGVENGTPRLFETDPSGTPYEWKAIAIGGNREEIQSHLEDNYSEELGLEGGIDLAIEALATPGDEEGFPPEGLAISTIDAETGTYRTLETDEIADRLTELDLLAEGEDE